jgi:hypothetical protein
MISAKHRSRQRGTAMMEAIMVNVVLLPLLAGIVFFQATYSARIQSLQNTRAYAWTYAYNGCNAVPEDSELGIRQSFGAPNQTVDPPDDATEQELGDTGNTVSGTGTELDNDPNYTNNVFGTGQGAAGWNVGTVNATSSVQMSSYDLLRVQGSVMTSSSHVQCNPTPTDSRNVANTFIQAARNLANW